MPVRTHSPPRVSKIAVRGPGPLYCLEADRYHCHLRYMSHLGDQRCGAEATVSPPRRRDGYWPVAVFNAHVNSADQGGRPSTASQVQVSVELRRRSPRRVVSRPQEPVEEPTSSPHLLASSTRTRPVSSTISGCSKCESAPSGRSGRHLRDTVVLPPVGIAAASHALTPPAAAVVVDLDRPASAAAASSCCSHSSVAAQYRQLRRQRKDLQASAAALAKERDELLAAIAASHAQVCPPPRGVTPVPLPPAANGGRLPLARAVVEGLQEKTVPPPGDSQSEQEAAAAKRMALKLGLEALAAAAM